MQKISPTVFSAGLISLALIISTALGSYVWYTSRLNDVLSVTGSAKQRITSDHVRWVSSFSRTIQEADLKFGYDQMSKDLVHIKNFFNSKGINETDLVIGPISMDQVYKQNDTAPKEYTLRQTIEINSDNVAQISDLSKNTNDLIATGVIFSTTFLEYSYSKLAELRVSLLENALKDAQARAQVLAKTTGASVGSLQSASSGVVQVLAANAVDVSDYGTYDTSSINKDIMVTVKASFSLR